jgi:hypothetical protein
MRVDALQQSSVGTLGADGQVDLGASGRIAVSDVEKTGMAPARAQATCLHPYATAWLLARTIAAHGNTWTGIAAYWSSSPYFNYRARALLNNELVAAGAIQAPLLRVPSMRPSESPWAPGFDQLEIRQFVFHD